MTDLPAPGEAPEDGRAAGARHFRLDEQTVDGIPVLRLVGEVDLDAAPAVRHRLAELAQDLGSSPGASAAHVVVLDLAEVSFIDSTGLSMLVAAHRRFDESGGELRVAAVPARVWRVLELTGLDRLLSAYDDVPSALRGPIAGSS